MALWLCGRCGTRYAVGLPYCPQCTSTDYREEGSEDVPKITVGGGPSNADLPPEPEPAAAEPESEVAVAAEPEPATAAGYSEPVPDGTISEVMAWVGSDPNRAADALAVELAKESPRSTLVARLQEVAL
jgi:hypothetical protein